MALSRIISSGSLKLDIALQIGGYPGGSIIEIKGLPSSGKTVLAQHAVAETQKLGGLCAWIDTDGMFCANMARNCGVDTDALYFCLPKSTEQAFETLLILTKSGVFNLIILDSLLTLTPNSQLVDNTEQQVLEHNQALLSFMLPTLTRAIKANGTTVLFTNHPDTHRRTVYHQLSTHLNRLALDFHATTRLRVQHMQHVEQKGKIVGQRIQARIIKNRFAPYIYETDFDIIHCEGINKTSEVFGLGYFLQKIVRDKQVFLYQQTILGQTPIETIQFLDQNQLIRDKIEWEIRRELIPEVDTAATS